MEEKEREKGQEEQERINVNLGLTDTGLNKVHPGRTVVTKHQRPILLEVENVGYLKNLKK